MKSMDSIVALCKGRGFIFPGSEIYGGLSNTWDYGPLGVEFKNNIKKLWMKKFVQESETNVGLDCAILMNPRVWEASGHVSGFSDPLMDCKECKTRYRADKLIEDAGFNPNGMTSEQMEEFIKEKEISCPNCKAKNFTGIRKFNLMFKTFQGVTEDKKSEIFLRPETAQGIFTNYKNVVDSFYPNMPFGLAQQGKAFRNEISPRDFVFRSREFEQMEIEYFVHPATWEENFEKMLSATLEFLTKNMAIPREKIHLLEVPAEDRAHYSKRTVDLEFDYPIGKEELMGIAYRTDFDLGNIQRDSGKNMEYTDKITKEKYVPHVIEPSFGVERLLMAVLTCAYREEETDGKVRTFLALPENLAPIKLIVAPLLKNKEALVEKAREVYATLKQKYGNVELDLSGKVGKVYAKADEIEGYVAEIITASREEFLSLDVTMGEFYLSELVTKIKLYYTEKLSLIKTDCSLIF